MKTHNLIIGKFLGYPDCCIKAFGDVAIPFVFRPENVKRATRNGFLPCPKHALMLLNKEITYNELINVNRKCSVPFKEKPTVREDEQIDMEIDLLTG